MATFEYRKLFRADAVLKVEYSTTKQPLVGGMAFSQNLSQTGINFITDNQLARDSELDLKIYISDSQGPVSAKGVVVWQSPCSFIPESKRKYFSIGVQICDMSPEDAIRESDFVKSCMVEKSERQRRKIIEKLEEGKHA